MVTSSDARPTVGRAGVPAGPASLSAISRVEEALLLAVVLGLALGIGLSLAGNAPLADKVWAVTTVPVLVALVVQIVTSLGKGDVGLDIIAALSMTAGLAFGEPLAANVVALMYAGGQQLENYAQSRAKREMTALLGRVARTAMRYVDGGLDETPVEDLAPGDRLLIRQGEVVPVDGTVASGQASLDQSALTGEAIPVERGEGGEVLSGTTSVGHAFALKVTRPAAESTYAGIVRLVESAQRSKAPMVRMADRYALWFLLLTLLAAGGAWYFSGDRLRALAVLVVATPCPLILAVPVAIISGLSRAAKFGVLVKSGGALEAMARVRTAIFDKTGTLTRGRAALIDIRTVDGFEPNELLRLAASLDQASSHVVAEALVEAARERHLALSNPLDAKESAGTGIVGEVDGHRLAVGGSGFVRSLSQGSDPRELRKGLPRGTIVVVVAVDGTMAGILALADVIRPDASQVLSAFRKAGIKRIVLASGDRADVVETVGQSLGVDRALGELAPASKVQTVLAERANGPVMMVGDGVNDAPALAAADVGVAMGARGAAASSEAADAVLLVDRLDPLASAVAVAHRTHAIALQSVLVGLGLSLGAMVVAGLGYLPPVQGALTQEAIDVAVILNALRALKAPGVAQRI